MRHKRQKINWWGFVGMLTLIIVAWMGTVIIVPDAGRTGECANNYERTTPDFCRYVGTGVVGFVETVGSTCTSLVVNSTDAIPSNSKAALARIQFEAKGTATAGTSHVTLIRIWDDSSCLTSFTDYSIQTIEWTAVTTDNIFAIESWNTIVPLLSANTIFYTVPTFIGSVNNPAAIRVIGYYD